MKQIKLNWKNLLLCCFIFASTTKMFAGTKNTQTSPLQHQTEMNNSNKMAIGYGLTPEKNSFPQITSSIWLQIIQKIQNGYSTPDEFIIWIKVIFLYLTILTVLAALLFLIIFFPQIVGPILLILIAIITFINRSNTTQMGKRSTFIKAEETLLLQDQLLSPSEEKTPTAALWEVNENQNIKGNNTTEKKEILELLVEIDKPLLSKPTTWINTTKTSTKESELMLKNSADQTAETKVPSTETEVLEEILTSVSPSLSPILEVLENSATEPHSKELNDSDPLSKMAKEASTEVQKLNLLEGLEVNVYPNPSDGPLTVELKNNAELQNQINVLVFSATGQVLFNEILQGHSVQFNLADYAPGAYLIKITDGQHALTKRLIKR